VSIRSWRIIQARYADRAFEGEGARLFGGRWNRPGTRMIYTSESLSLATLEILVNLDSPDTLDQYLSIPVEFDEELCKALEFDALPGNWASDPPPPGTQQIGSNWVAARESAVLVVPSAVVRREHNFLLNPEHPDFSQVRIGNPSEFALDPRLVRGF
jgi:RES domain-containing protein